MDRSAFGGHDYTPDEIALGYGSDNDPRFSKPQPPTDEAREAIIEYVAACQHEADEAAAEGEDLLFGPRSRAAKERVNTAYQRLYEIADVSGGDA